MNGQNVRPGHFFYGLGALLLIISIFGAALLGHSVFKDISGLTDMLRQVVVPGKSDITLVETGKYTIFYEHESVVGDKVYWTGQSFPAGLECHLKNKATGAGVPLARPMGSSTYSLGQRSGQSILEFRIDQPGTYEISAAYGKGQSGPDVVIAVGHGFAKAIIVVAAKIISVLIFFLLGAAAIAMILVIIVKRRKTRKQLVSDYS